MLSKERLARIMPTYDYVCDACGYKFEEFQRMSDEPLTICPSCNAEAIRRLIGSGAGIIFKGEGFYATDYRDVVPPGKKDEE